MRAHTWLWATLLAAAVFLLAYWGPVEVLVPYRVRNELGGSAGDFGSSWRAASGRSSRR